MSNPYDILGISSDDDDAEIKKAYRKLVNENHPDRYPDSEKKFILKKCKK